MAPRVVIDFSGSVELALEDVWPDGVPPLDQITAQAVAAHIEAECVSKADLLTDWNLAEDLEVDVYLADDQGRTGPGAGVWT